MVFTCPKRFWCGSGLVGLALLLMLLSTLAGLGSGYTKRAPACLKPGELCVPMIRRLIGTQYSTEPYCCNTTCLPLPRPMNGICTRFFPQIAGPRTSSTSTTTPSPSPDAPADQRYLYYY